MVKKENIKRTPKAESILRIRVLIHKIRYQEIPTMHDIHVVRGKLNFLRMVKGSDNPTYIEFYQNFTYLV